MECPATGLLSATAVAADNGEADYDNSSTAMASRQQQQHTAAVATKWQQRDSQVAETAEGDAVAAHATRHDARYGRCHSDRSGGSSS